MGDIFIGLPKAQAAEERRERAFLYGESNISPSEMCRPIGMPKCVADSRRGRRGQGLSESSSLSRGIVRGGPEMTQLLSLLTPRPRVEKRLIRLRAGEMSKTVREARAIEGINNDAWERS